VAPVLKQEDQSRLAEEIREWLSSQTFGSLSPVTVELRRDPNSDDEEAWFFDVVLPNPDPAEEAWPIDDIVDLQLSVRDEALRRGLAWPWYVFFKPETEEEFADEDALEPPLPAS
jgi:hypothetical protein